MPISDEQQQKRSHRIAQDRRAGLRATQSMFRNVAVSAMARKVSALGKPISS